MWKPHLKAGSPNSTVLALRIALPLRLHHLSVNSMMYSRNHSEGSEDSPQGGVNFETSLSSASLNKYFLPIQGKRKRWESEGKRRGQWERGKKRERVREKFHFLIQSSNLHYS